MHMPDWSRKEAIDRVRQWKESGEIIVFTNGCFDILHAGHVHYLKEAKNLGDRLIIGLNSDQSVRNLKGQDRPLNSEEARTLVLNSLTMVDGVTIFHEDDPGELIEDILPHVLVKGGDYSEEEVVGADTVRNYGGKVVLIPYLEGYSTSGIIHRIRKD